MCLQGSCGMLGTVKTILCVWCACVVCAAFIVCSEKNKKSHYFQVYLRRKNRTQSVRVYVCVCVCIYNEVIIIILK